MEQLKLRQIMALLAVMAAISLSFTCILSAIQGVFFPFTWTADYTRVHYGITIDAGSHGTRSHIFKWSGRVEDPEAPWSSPVTVPEEISVFDLGVNPISAYMKQPHNVGSQVLKPLLDQSLKVLKSLPNFDGTDLKSIPVFLKATAGMRNMDSDARDGVMGAIRQFLGNRSLNPFNFRPDWARVISGEEEGVFGWIATNNMQGTLLSPAFGTTGALDLGGASSQITFSPTQTSVLEDFYELKLADEITRLYSHSFLGYGWGDAQMRLTTRLALEAIFAQFAKSKKLDKKQHNNVADAALEQDVNSIKMKHGPASATKKKAVLYANPDIHEHSSVGKIKMLHPCFPVGHKVIFDLPSLIYPDGRAFLDMDVRSILAYINLLGVDLNSSVIKKSFSSELIDQMKSHSQIGGKLLPPVMDKIIHNIDFIPATIDDVHSEDESGVPFHPFSEPLPAGKLHYRILFKGSGDFIQCQKRARELFYQEPCFLSTCSYNGVYQPGIAESKFLALGQFAKVRQALGISTTATPNTLEKRTYDVCTMNATAIKHAHKNGSFAPFGKHSVFNLCWKSVWAHATLTTGYGFDGDSRAVTFFDLNAATEGGSKQLSPGWATGAMLYEVSFFPWQNGRGRFEAPFWWALASCAILVSLCFCLRAKMLHYRSKLDTIRKGRSDVYQEFSA